MQLPSIPGPASVRRVADRAGDFLDDLAGLVPRAAAVLTAAESLVAQVQALVDRVELTRAEAHAVVERVELTRAEAYALVSRFGVLVDDLEPTLTKLHPTLEQLAESTDPAEVRALVALVDRLPRLADELEGSVLPVLETMTSVAPDLHELLAIASQLNEVLGRVPGMGRIKKKVEEEQDELDGPDGRPEPVSS